MSPSGTSPDVRAVVRALDALTTQVKRLANHTANPASFALAPPVADDRDTPTTGVTRVPCPYCVAPTMIPSTLITDHIARLHNVGLATYGPYPAVEEAAVCRRMETRTCPEAYNGPCGDRPCARFESDDPAPWWGGTGEVKQWAPVPYPSELAEDERPVREHLAADEDQALRWARRESLLVLLTRLQRGRTLTEDEARTLREHVEHEMREGEMARAVVADHRTETRALREKLERYGQDAGEQRRRADIAETELRVLREGLRANGADPTQIQNLWAQIRLRNRQWREAKREAAVTRSMLESEGGDVALVDEMLATVAKAEGEAREAQDAIERVRALADRWNLDGPPPGNRPLTDLRAALDGTEQLTEQQPSDPTRPHAGLDGALRIVADWCDEARKMTGTDEEDLARHLEDAGYRLPTTGTRQDSP